MCRLAQRDVAPALPAAVCEDAIDASGEGKSWLGDCALGQCHETGVHVGNHGVVDIQARAKGTVEGPFMKMPQLRELTVGTDDLFLDPNNPRFLDLAEEVRQVPIERVTESKVQEKALARILDSRYEVKQLKESIRNIGFLTVDRLVVLALPQEGKFMVVEGNRRLAAVKSLLGDDASGEVTLDGAIRASLKSLPVVVLDAIEGIDREHFARVLQGVRHVARVRDWGPYQQAQLVATMIDDGKEPIEIAEILGLPMRRINQLRRGYYALKQMREDTDFAEYASPKLFSHFDEVFKLPKVRDWMQWDDRESLFLNEVNRRTFYALIVGEEYEGQRMPSRLSDPKNVRDLGELMDDPIRFRQFRETATLPLQDALRGVISPERKVDWRAGIAQVLNTMRQIPAVDLMDPKGDDLKLLEEVQNLCSNLIKQARSAK